MIALWLGHESVESTQMYVHADIQLKGTPPDYILGHFESST